MEGIFVVDVDGEMRESGAYAQSELDDCEDCFKSVASYYCLRVCIVLNSGVGEFSIL